MKNLLLLIAVSVVLSITSFGQTEKPDIPLKIISKPSPKWSDRQDCSTGIITIRVEFLKTGEIGEIQLISGLTKSRNEDAIEATKLIKFEPARKNGEAVTLKKKVQYTFYTLLIIFRIFSF